MFLRRLGAPGGTLLDDLPKARKAAHMAVAELRSLPNREPNHDLRILAAVTARVFIEDLDARPASSRHTHFRLTGDRGGAAFSRALESVFALAGVPNTDLEKWITAGLKLANDFDTPI